ncbi:succinate dehydrogenase [ubiquinone] cytochrome b small subunit, mitochondrial-like [Diorhabda carinulata]|uniref:succinate dehydrogenase [ubiquinone] cytochrome b small subunit, mitochondrial-like n=1 Tax=Diorhabda carinulata TaxID=1163345 RepID=UPI0025A0C7F0|nr:succinate dehydrogenase [ubiquinone] cytochrome b small subunit, mitochondrial-like [Diorhabda carinulata]
MALAIILNNSLRPSVFQNILQGTASQSKTRKWFTQLSKSRNSTNHSKLLQRLPLTILPNIGPKRLMSSNHAKLWPLEKIVNLLLLGVIPATFIAPNIVLNDLFAGLTCLHMNWGLEGVVLDYVRPIIFGSAIPKLAILLLYLISLSTFVSLIYYNHKDIGIGCTFRKFWEITDEDE